MNPLLLAAPQVHVFWASLHDWPAGQTWFSVNNVTRLWLILDGAIEIAAAPREERAPQSLSLTAGDLFLSDTRAYNIATPQGARWLSVGLNATAVPSVDLLRPLSPPRCWHPDEEKRHLVETLLRTLIECWHGTADYPNLCPNAMGYDLELARCHDAVADLVCRSIATALVALCWEMGENSGEALAADSGAPDWLARGLRYLERNLSADIGEVAHKVGVSPAQFRRGFRQWTGMAPRDYLQQQRLRAARLLLETTNQPVAAIAQQTGFASASHFTRFWQQHHGHTPSQHRTLMRGAKV
jgi:AraC-like DNA-binding protein